MIKKNNNNKDRIITLEDVLNAARENRKILAGDDVRFTALALEVGTRDNVIVTKAEAAPRPFVVAGNWKMNCDLPQTLSLLEELSRGLDPSIAAAYAQRSSAIMVAPPFTSLAIAARFLEGTPFQLGAQNMSAQASGAHTGEVSASMLLSCGVSWCILGHSERRAMGETDETIAARVAAAQAAGIRPVLCVGESLKARENQRTFSVVRQQIEQGLTKASVQNLCVAYEPIWAIGTGKAANPDDAAAVHAYIRDQLVRAFGPEAAQVPILYGGSVTNENCASYFSQPDIDGALVGGASLTASKFLTIVNQCALARSGQ